MIRAASNLSVGLRRSRHVLSRVSPSVAPLSNFSDEESNTETKSTFSLSIALLDLPLEGGFSGQKRYMSSDSNSPKPNFDETMDKLFHEAQQEAKGDGDAWFLDEAAGAAFEPSWWNLSDHSVNAVHWMHELTGLHYAGSIFATTCALRFVILPLAVRSQRAASRMAHVQPELAVIKQRYEALGTPTQAEQKAFGEQMKALFARYEVKPFASLAAPLIQAPLFIGMFFGMKKISDIFSEEMATGGILWFTDLTVPDPTYILPLVCGVSFLTTIEAGKEQMIDSNAQYGPVMVNAFRAMAVVMIPVMTTFPAAMLCYWVPNNLFTLLQSVALRNGFVKKQLGIWDRPKPVPGSNTDAGFQETMTNLVKKAKGEPTTDAEILRRHNEEIETKKRVKQMSKATRARRREDK
jgi:YidC/Oxa1 family membrane protein insertase